MKKIFVIYQKLSGRPSGDIMWQNKYTGGAYMGAIFESIMLICFGLSWPLNVIKAYRARTAKGMSLPFILLIITGYIAGITAKLVTDQINYVLVVYLVNLAIVSMNVLVYFRNLALDRKLNRQLEEKLA